MTLHTETLHILILDDQEILLANNHSYDGVRLIQTIDAEKFFKLLYTFHWDEVWLDHDMGLQRLSGSQISYKILENVKLHSSMADVDHFMCISNNPGAGNKMADDLRQAGYQATGFPMYKLQDGGVYRGEMFRETDHTIETERQYRNPEALSGDPD